MRPTRLELEGFASFRDQAVLDLADADLFVLSGPTGAGKSSLIDAMTFALYGSVPRFEDERLVEPVISKGRSEARIRLDFRVAEHAYTAVRVVRRDRAGRSSTKEARLERWRGADPEVSDVLASGADDVTAAVTDLLGLSFRHFNTCVVLPQGTFQWFLHAKPSERQKLLVQLLDLHVYARIGSAARERAKAEEQRVTLLQRRLDGELADATEEAAKIALARVEELRRLAAEVDEREPALEAIQAEGRAQRDAADEASARAARLAGIAVPAGVEALAARVAAATSARDRATAATARATVALADAEAARAALGDLAPLQQQRDRIARLGTLRAQHDDLSADVAARAAALADAEAAAAAAAAGLAEARTELQRAQQEDLAATLAQHLHAGDTCPVCERTLEEDPQRAPAGALAAATVREQAATQADRDAQHALSAAQQQHGRLTAQSEVLAGQLAGLTDEATAATAAGAPATAEAVDAQLALIGAADGAVAGARADLQRAHEAERATGAELEQASREVQTAWHDLDDTRQALADLAPPGVDRSDLAGSWASLASWARTRRPELERAAAEAEASVAATRERWQTAAAELRQTVTAAGVEPTAAGTIRDAVRDALSAAQRAHERITERIEQAASLRTQIEQARSARAVAHALGQHLKADRFEQWLLRRALHRLVAGATAQLQALSGGAYSLALDGSGGFEVIDHRNADETRSARTLSGGETFLASLALALALADDVAALAANGAARLESLFLDEGFGTLDAESLDVVAAALGELGTRGRMVGVITHVPALAQQLPVRFDVTKVGPSSSVCRAVDDDGGPA